MESTIWSWATDRPETGFAQPRAVVVSVEDGGRWTDVDSDSGLGEIHSYACRNSDSGMWVSCARVCACVRVSVSCVIFVYIDGAVCPSKSIRVPCV